MADDSKVTIQVDGRAIEARKGAMLIEATDAAGIDVPRFCYHSKLSVAANCRMCLVEVEKAPKPLPACATPVTDGMVVRTASPVAPSSRMPAISSPKRTHRVQWMQRVMSVAISGPIFLSRTTRLPST